MAASSTIHVSRSRVRRLGSVVFSGGLRGGLVPAAGKIVQLQVLVNGRWQVFANPKTDRRGRWRHRYRFTGRYTQATYRFRLRVPAEKSYPFAAGTSSAVTVKVR